VSRLVEPQLFIMMVDPTIVTPTLTDGNRLAGLLETRPRVVMSTFLLNQRIPTEPDEFRFFATTESVVEKLTGNVAFPAIAVVEPACRELCRCGVSKFATISRSNSEAGGSSSKDSPAGSEAEPASLEIES